MQLDRAERGFAYSQEAPLDMRMDPDAPLTAADVVNTYDEKALARVLREFGEERFASRIAREIVRRRQQQPFTTTRELVELLYVAIPAPARRTGGHPAKRTFQALRTAVNGELDSLRDALPAAMEALSAGGRIVVMSYQSLEDKIVKSQFTAATASRTPEGLPVDLPGHEPYFVTLTRGAEKADVVELDLNPRSASVRLRALEKNPVRREDS
jgi:16S rRNA (cytosine1402-N4)-methyltransferase